MNTMVFHRLNPFSLALTASARNRVHAEEAVGPPITVIKGLVTTEGHNVATSNGTRSHQLLGVNISDTVVGTGEIALTGGETGTKCVWSQPNLGIQGNAMVSPGVAMPGLGSQNLPKWVGRRAAA